MTNGSPVGLFVWPGGAIVLRFVSHVVWNNYSDNTRRLWVLLDVSHKHETVDMAEEDGTALIQALSTYHEVTCSRS